MLPELGIPREANACSVPLDATDDKDIMAASPQLLCECDSLKVFTVLE